MRVLATGQGLNFGAVWTAAGVIVAFSVTSFTFRIKRESEMRTAGQRYWLPPADFVLMFSLAIALVGVFVLPVLGAGLSFAKYALGWAFLLLAGYPFALAGHYDILFGEVPLKTRIRRRRKGFPRVTAQERGVLLVLAAASVVYFVAVVVREVE